MKKNGLFLATSPCVILRCRYFTDSFFEGGGTGEGTVNNCFVLYLYSDISVFIEDDYEYIQAISLFIFDALTLNTLHCGPSF